MTVVCPEGHRSGSTDYCDTCGSPIGAPASPGMQSAGSSSPSPSTGSPTATPEAAAEPLTCPHCGGLNVQDALFCEECGYDFTTGTPPMGSEPAPAQEPEADPEPDPEMGLDEAEGLDEPDGDHREADGDHEEADGDHEGEADGDHEEKLDGDHEKGPDEAATEEPQETPETGPSSDPEPDPDPAPDPDPEPEQHPEATPAPGTSPGPAPAPAGTSTRGKPRHTPPSRALSRTWVVELWVDPDWYAVQQTEEACPSAGVPDIVLLRRSSALIGRPSGSLGVRPEVDAGTDSAVSRRHAQLSSDGQRWWIEDLGSSNGTFVGTVGDPLPSAPITPGQRIELDRDDRIYLGAWTRLALRPATPAEEQGQG